MKKCFYFAENQKNISQAGMLLPGFGFRADGMWRSRALPAEGLGILLDDRWLPSRPGLEAACRSLSDWRGLIVLDFERSPKDPLVLLAKRLSGKRLVLPPSYVSLPHEAVLIGPWQAECGFFRWLQRSQAQFGRVVLDAAPVRLQCFPGGRRGKWRRPLPEVGYPCPALGCLHRRLSDGSVLFWDTRETLSARLAQAQIPAIVFQSDWDALPGKEATLQGDVEAERGGGI